MKRAIIFGATGGIGRAIAENMAANGWSLYIHYNHNQQEAGKMVQEFIENYPSQEFFSLKLNFSEKCSYQMKQLKLSATHCKLIWH